MDARESMSRASLRGGPSHLGGQLRPVPGLARQRPQLVRDAHASLQDRVEVVLLQQLGAAERQHVRVHVPAGQLRPQVVGPLLRLPDSWPPAP